MAHFDKVLHIAILGFYVAVWISLLSRDITNFKHPDAQQLVKFGARFLTKWTYAVQFVYYVTIVVADILSLLKGLQKVSLKIRSFADLLFSTIVLPVGLIVTVSFWTFYNIDRELVYPKWIDSIIPLWINHGIHTFNSVLPFIDLLFVKHNFSSFKTSLISIIIYLGAYLVCTLETYYTYGKWLYPILAKLTLLQRTCLFISIPFIAIVFYGIVRFINKLRWGTADTFKEKPKIKKNKQKIKKAV